MTPETQKLQAIEARLAKVEKQNRWMKRGGCAILLVFALVLVMGYARPRRTIEAEQFLLLDAKGHEKLAIGTPRTSGASDLAPDDAAIWFVGDNGRDRAILTGDGLRFADEKGRPLRSYLPD